MKDIETRVHIDLIMRAFYKLLLEDERINFFFQKVTQVDQDLEAHFEILATFWEQSLFMKGGYSNNMFKIHQNLHEKSPFKQEHFQIWLAHFNQAIERHFEGPNADQMKTQALSMATVMQIKFQ